MADDVIQEGQASDDVWRPVVGWPLYEVTADGRVRKRTTGRAMVASGKNLSIHMYVDHRDGVIPLKRVVYEAWVNDGRPLPKRAYIYHRDGNQLNCRAENLTIASDLNGSHDTPTEWRPVVGWPLYEVSEDGQVRNRATGVPCRVSLRVTGYGGRAATVSLVRLGDDGTSNPPNKVLLRRVVYEAWVNDGEPLPRDTWLVNVDDDPLNCSAANVAIMPEEQRAAIRSAASFKGGRTKAAARGETEDEHGPTDGRHNVLPSGFRNSWDTVRHYDGTASSSPLAEKLVAEERTHCCSMCRWYVERSAGWGECRRGPRKCTTTPDARCAAWRLENGKEGEWLRKAAMAGILG